MVNFYRQNSVPLPPREPKVDAWLLHRDSMTKKLKAHCKNNVRIDVLFHDWSLPKREDVDYLGLDSTQKIIYRTVMMLSDDIPVLYAHTAIPKAVIDHTGEELLKLGTRPIGEILFNDTKVKRSEFELALLTAGDRDYDEAINHSGIDTKKLWARRSQFELEGKGTIAITETFLPNCWNN